MHNLSLAVVHSILEQTRSIGSTWPLFFYVIANAEFGELKTTYSEMSKTLNVPIPTLKTWRRNLVDKKLLLSRCAGHFVLFILRDEWKEITNINTDEIKAENNNGLLPIIVNLAEKIGRLESQIAK